MKALSQIHDYQTNNLNKETSIQATITYPTLFVEIFIFIRNIVYRLPLFHIAPPPDTFGNISKSISSFNRVLSYSTNDFLTSSIRILS